MELTRLDRENNYENFEEPEEIVKMKKEIFKAAAYLRRINKHEKTKVWTTDRFTYGRGAGKTNRVDGLNFLANIPENQKNKRIPGVSWEMWTDRFPVAKKV